MSHMQLLVLPLRMQWPLIRGVNEAPVSQGLCQSGSILTPPASPRPRGLPS